MLVRDTACIRATREPTPTHFARETTAALPELQVIDAMISSGGFGE